jgi:hypothetical protein
MKHFSEDQVTSALLDIVPVEFEESVLVHLAKCDICEGRAKPALERYRELRREAIRRVPPPPRPWRDIGIEMDRADAILRGNMRTESTRRARPVWTGVAATAALGTVLLLWPRPDGDLRAETLLPKIEASVAQGPSRARQGLRVHTSTATFVRAARVGTMDNSNGHWRERFRAAQYDWNDPLSPRAYSEWRNSVTHKSDRVIVSAASAVTPKLLTIQTTAPEGLLQDASLTVDAASLMPVSAKFAFSGNEWIEISVVPNYSPEAEIAVSGSRPLTKPAAPVETGMPRQLSAIEGQAATELAVWLLADRLNDIAAEPVRMDIRSGTRISVTPYSLNARQLQQFSSGLQGLPDVDLHSPNSSQAALEEPPERDPVINLSEIIFSRAHLLADLAAHFPENTELHLSSSSRIQLWELRSRHATQLEQEVRSLETLLNERVSASREDSNTGEISAEILAQEAGRVNRAVVIAAARQQSPPADLGRLREIATQYASSVAQSLEKLR